MVVTESGCEPEPEVLTVTTVTDINININVVLYWDIKNHPINL